MKVCINTFNFFPHKILSWLLITTELLRTIIMMFRLHTLVSAALFLASGTDASSANINKKYHHHRNLGQEFMISQKTSTRRHLDVSRECLKETEEIWNNETVEWLSPEEIVTLCEDSPCDIRVIDPEYHSEYKQSCDALGGQFIEYSVKLTEEAFQSDDAIRRLKAPFFLTITNLPDCIAKTCDEDQFMSYTKGGFLGMYLSESDAEVHFINENSISEECIEGVINFMQELDFMMPFEFECDENPCDVSIVDPLYYANVTTGCEDLGGKAINYTIQIDELAFARKLENETFFEFINYPFCIDPQTCDETHVASFMQSTLDYEGPGGNSVFVISPTSSATSTGPIALASFLTASIAIMLFV